jgi:hypothetical protein
MEKRVSPPKAVVDSSPLLINKNRECKDIYLRKKQENLLKIFFYSFESQTFSKKIRKSAC